MSSFQIKPALLLQVFQNILFTIKLNDCLKEFFWPSLRAFSSAKYLYQPYFPSLAPSWVGHLASRQSEGALAHDPGGRPVWFPYSDSPYWLFWQLSSGFSPWGEICSLNIYGALFIFTKQKLQSVMSVIHTFTGHGFQALLRGPWVEPRSRSISASLHPQVSFPREKGAKQEISTSHPENEASAALSIPRSLLALVSPPVCFFASLSPLQGSRDTCRAWWDASGTPQRISIRVPPGVCHLGDRKYNKLKEFYLTTQRQTESESAPLPRCRCLLPKYYTLFVIFLPIISLLPTIPFRPLPTQLPTRASNSAKRRGGATREAGEKQTGQRSPAWINTGPVITILCQHKAWPKPGRHSKPQAVELLRAGDGSSRSLGPQSILLPWFCGAADCTPAAIRLLPIAIHKSETSRDSDKQDQIMIV